jgi:chromosome segregation ATPase
MTTLLSNEEKTGIINQHLKNLHYNKFNIEMSIVEENAKTTPEAESLASLTSQLSDLDSRIEALEAELDKLV